MGRTDGTLADLCATEQLLTEKLSKAARPDSLKYVEGFKNVLRFN